MLQLTVMRVVKLKGPIRKKEKKMREILRILQSLSVVSAQAAPYSNETGIADRFFPTVPF